MHRGYRQPFGCLVGREPDSLRFPVVTPDCSTDAWYSQVPTTNWLFCWANGSTRHARSRLEGISTPACWMLLLRIAALRSLRPALRKTHPLADT